ncbi:MAG: hypothetical protein KGL63_13760 [Betaproteobacteria bacterium]|nr:hypothetical protein [Betaproteobacteria bacterium]
MKAHGKVDDETFIEALREHGSDYLAAKALGLDSRGVTRRRLRMEARMSGPLAGPAPAAIEYPKLPQKHVPIEELLARRKSQFQQRKSFEDSTKLIPVKIKLDGPIGVLHFGDPHVDDDGTDIVALESHARLVRETEGMFGGNVGDTSNNWVGRLTRLWAQQSTNADEAWQLVEWFIKQVDWLYLIGGNHDAWSGAGDPIKWIQRGGSAPYMASSVRLALQFPNKNEVRVNAKHDFNGHSQWNPAHGATKAIYMGPRDHIAVAGHRHISGYNIIKSPEDGTVCHAIRVASYKIYDTFAKEKGFPDQSLSPCAVTVIDPALPGSHPDQVKVFWDAFEGADFLKYKRKKWKC